MLYRFGTTDEVYTCPIQLPDEVTNELIIGTSVLASEYGENRDYLNVGGYSIVIETIDDLPAIKSILDCDAHPCEWATRLGKSGYLSALYIINDDFSIMLFMPIAVAPAVILNELEN